MIRSIALGVLTVFVALAFVGAGMAKLTAQPMMVAEFTGFGYPLWFMTVTGSIEIVSAILLLVPRTAAIGAGFLSCVMIGALFSHLTHGQAGMIAAPLILLILSLAIGTLRGWGRGAVPRVSRSHAAGI